MGPDFPVTSYQLPGPRQGPHAKLTPSPKPPAGGRGGDRDAAAPGLFCGADARACGGSRDDGKGDQAPQPTTTAGRGLNRNADVLRAEALAGRGAHPEALRRRDERNQKIFAGDKEFRRNPFLAGTDWLNGMSRGFLRALKALIHDHEMLGASEVIRAPPALVEY